MTSFQDYLTLLSRGNGLAGEAPPSPENRVDWFFYPGMLQESCRKWWADFGTRATCHEGIDICFYRVGHGPVTPLLPGTRVPAMAGGQVLNISPDLLGKSIVISCPGEPDRETLPVMVYSHLDPAPGLSPGDEVAPGTVIGRTFDTRIKKSKLRSHLHISCICLPKGTAAEKMNWTLFADRSRVFHMNPVFVDLPA